MVFQGSSVFESFIVACHSLIVATRAEGGHVYQLVQSVIPRGCRPKHFLKTQNPISFDNFMAKKLDARYRFQAISRVSGTYCVLQSA